MMCLQVGQAIVTTVYYYYAVGSKELPVGYRTTSKPLATSCMNKKVVILP